MLIIILHLRLHRLTIRYARFFTILDIHTHTPSVSQAPSFPDVLFASSKHLDHPGNGGADDEPSHPGQHDLHLEAVHDPKSNGAAKVLPDAAAGRLLPVVTHEPRRDDPHQQRRRQVDAHTLPPHEPGGGRFVVTGGGPSPTAVAVVALRSVVPSPLVNARRGSGRRQVQLRGPVVVVAARGRGRGRCRRRAFPLAPGGDGFLQSVRHRVGGSRRCRRGRRRRRRRQEARSEDDGCRRRRPEWAPVPPV